MRLQFELSQSGISKAIRQLQEHEKENRQKLNELTKRLSEIGARVASIEFSKVNYLGDNDVSVTVEPVQGGYKIVASGKAVCFIEFGTGEYAGAGYDIPAPVSISPGSWSISHAKQYVKQGYWYYNGIQTYGDYPAKAMYKASKEIKQQLEKIAKEVFT